MHLVWFGGLMPIHLIIKYGAHMRANLVSYWPHLSLCSEPVTYFAMLRQHLKCRVAKQLEPLEYLSGPRFRLI